MGFHGSGFKIMDQATWAILLLLAGLLLVATEVFIPSGGLIAVASAGCLVFSIVCAWQAWWPSQPIYFWSYLGALSVVIPAVGIAALRVWPHTPIGRRAILQAPTQDEVLPFQDEEQHLKELVGRIGETVTILNPAGMMVVDHERLHCQSEGMIIDAWTPVRVISVQGNRVIVRKHAGGGERQAPTPDPKSTPLDFDLS